MAETVALANVVDYLNWLINSFGSNGVSEGVVSKMKDALNILLEVLKMEAELGVKGVPMQAKVLSDKNQTMVKDALESISELGASIQNVKQQLEALSQATEPSKSAGSGETAVDPHVKRINNLILRDARQGVKSLNKVLLRLKQK